MFFKRKKAYINFSCLAIGLLYFILGFFQSQHSTISLMFSIISGMFLAAWIITSEDHKTVLGILAEIISLLIFIFSLIHSLNFILNFLYSTYGKKFIIYSILSSIGLFYCCVYLTLKFVSIFNYIKKIIRKIQKSIFNFQEDRPSKLKLFLQNTTAILIALSGITVAIKSIVEPLITLLKK